MPGGLLIVPPPAEIFRVARRGRDPFAPPPWSIASPDGTFGNRFDDPGCAREVDPCERFRMIYCATTPAGAFGETLARFRPSIPFLAKLRHIDDDEDLESQFAGALDPTDPSVGVVPADWRLRRVLARTSPAATLRCVDISAPETHQHLRHALSTDIAALGLRDLDFSTVTGPYRELTQRCARYIFDLCDEERHPLYAGLRYVSRLNPLWECWALFSDRMIHTPGFPATIGADNPDLLAIGELFRLSIQTIGGHDHYVRPVRR